MNKFFNFKSIISFGTIALMIFLVVLLARSCRGERLVTASVMPSEIMLGQQITFADSTAWASNWLWEFGDGESSYEQSGTYCYPETGRYQVRLRVNGKYEKLFLVRVKPYTNEVEDHLIRIEAQETAFTGEYIIFSGMGDDKEWRWDFDNDGIIDSRDKIAMYAFDKQGIYNVKLSTESTQYPIMHLIEILPRFDANDTTEGMNNAELDIQKNLQEIADGKPFNTPYNYIKNTYLNGNENLMVTVNNSKRNDFYSYCQGLKIIGVRKTIIQTVIAERDDSENPRIVGLSIVQHDKK